MLSSMSMSTATIKEIDFEVSHSWDNDDEEEGGWDTEEGSGGRLPGKKRSLPAVTAAARPKTRHRSVGTTMAPAAEEELLVVGKGGRVRRTKVRRVSKGAALLGLGQGRDLSDRSLCSARFFQCHGEVQWRKEADDATQGLTVRSKAQ